MLYMMGLGALIFETEGVILVVDFPALPLLMYVSAGVLSPFTYCLRFTLRFTAYFPGRKSE